MKLKMKLKPFLIPIGCLLCLCAGVPPSFALDAPLSLDQLQPDPLLPSQDLRRDLSPLERSTLEKAIVELNQNAQTLLDQGNADQAFKLWFRVLNLARALGRSQEIKALGDIGDRAWSAGRKPELQAITQRLKSLDPSLRNDRPSHKKTHSSGDDNGNRDYSTHNYFNPSSTSDPAEVMDLGFAYQKVRNLDAAEHLYSDQLKIATSLQDSAQIKSLLEQLVQVEWGALNYAKAADYTQQQLDLLRSQRATAESLQQERSFLLNLAFFSQNLEHYPQQAAALQEAMDLTLDLGFNLDVADLLNQLGQAQEAAKTPDLAMQSYQKAYQFAQENQQFEIAQTVLMHLGQLQERQGQLQAAIGTYEILRQVRRYSSNLLGLLDSYDQLGQLYLQTQQRSKAQAEFEAGLTLAKRMKYREAEFEARLQQF